MQTKVEVQLVAFNGRDSVRQTLQSLRDHPCLDETLITAIAVLDNASSDGCADMIAAEFPDVRLVRQSTNTLYGPASNRLIETTEAAFIMMLNPDAIVSDDIVGPLLSAFRKFPEISVAYPGLVDSEGTSQPVGQRFPTLHFELALLLRGTRLAAAAARWWNAPAVVADVRFPAITPDLPYAFDVITSTCLLMPTAVALAYGPFEPDLPMYDCDLDLSRRMAADGRTAVFVSSCRVAHLGGASSTSQWKRRMAAVGRKSYYDKHHGRLTGALFAGLNGSLVGIKRLRNSVA